MSKIKGKVLIVEDEPSIADSLEYTIEREGFQVFRSATLVEARQAIDSNSLSAIVLDVGLPDGSGFDLCKEVRATSNVPILFLTARSDEIDRVVGFEIGADDYVTKPFSPREVAARLKAILRRVNGNNDEAVECYPIKIDSEMRKVTFLEMSIELSRYEYGILELLLKRPGQVYSREQIMDSVWESPDMSLSRTVDTHVKTIRAKLKAIDSSQEILITHRGVGYSLKEL